MLKKRKSAKNLEKNKNLIDKVIIQRYNYIRC